MSFLIISFSSISVVPLISALYRIDVVLARGGLHRGKTQDVRVGPAVPVKADSVEDPVDCGVPVPIPSVPSMLLEWQERRLVQPAYSAVACALVLGLYTCALPLARGICRIDTLDQVSWTLICTFT